MAHDETHVLDESETSTTTRFKLLVRVPWFVCLSFACAFPTYFITQGLYWDTILRGLLPFDVIALVCVVVLLVRTRALPGVVDKQKEQDGAFNSEATFLTVLGIGCAWLYVFRMHHDDNRFLVGSFSVVVAQVLAQLYYILRLEYLYHRSGVEIRVGSSLVLQALWGFLTCYNVFWTVCVIGTNLRTGIHHTADAFAEACAIDFRLDSLVIFSVFMFKFGDNLNLTPRHHIRRTVARRELHGDSETTTQRVDEEERGDGGGGASVRRRRDSDSVRPHQEIDHQSGREVASITGSNGRFAAIIIATGTFLNRGPLSLSGWEGNSRLLRNGELVALIGNICQCVYLIVVGGALFVGLRRFNRQRRAHLIEPTPHISFMRRVVVKVRQSVRQVHPIRLAVFIAAEFTFLLGVVLRFRGRIFELLEVVCKAGTLGDPHEGDFCRSWAMLFVIDLLLIVFMSIVQGVFLLVAFKVKTRVRDVLPAPFDNLFSLGVWWIVFGNIYRSLNMLLLEPELGTAIIRLLGVFGGDDAGSEHRRAQLTSLLRGATPNVYADVAASDSNTLYSNVTIHGTQFTTDDGFVLDENSLHFAETALWVIVALYVHTYIALCFYAGEVGGSGWHAQTSALRRALSLDNVQKSYVSPSYREPLLPGRGDDGKAPNDDNDNDDDERGGAVAKGVVPQVSLDEDDELGTAGADESL